MHAYWLQHLNVVKAVKEHRMQEQQQKTVKTAGKIC